MFNAVHAGSEQGWKSGHLEPFFCGKDDWREILPVPLDPPPDAA
jgi:hypothetical protein